MENLAFETLCALPFPSLFLCCLFAPYHRGAVVKYLLWVDDQPAS